MEKRDLRGRDGDEALEAQKRRKKTSNPFYFQNTSLKKKTVDLDLE